ncbi:MAG TPA: hypothetical protein VEZ42_21985, partial [Pseudonocardia sp.]|nr:hypothetical protein [Pseudonocardia sp.]
MIRGPEPVDPRPGSVEDPLPPAREQLPLPRRRQQAHLEPQLREPNGAGAGTPFSAFTTPHPAPARDGLTPTGPPAASPGPVAGPVPGSLPGRLARPSIRDRATPPGGEPADRTEDVPDPGDRPVRRER